MIRLRRYRVFLLVAVVSLTIVWYVSRDSSYEELRNNGLSGLRGYGGFLSDARHPQVEDHERDGAIGSEKQAIEEKIQPAAEIVHPNHAATAVFPAHGAQATPSSSSSSSSPHSSPGTTRASTTSSTSGAQRQASTTSQAAQLTPQSGEHAQVSLDSLSRTGYVDPTYTWSSRTERFPVSTTIQLPTGTPRPIPKIQYDFAPDPPTVKNELKLCMTQIRKSMKRTWDGYRKYAWMKDELRPVTGGYKDKFMGWAATLVDSLDTLYIMGMDKEFEEAINATAHINFKESTETRLPMFETTIRYLGGLLGAYDISEQKHKVLLDKAVELAEVLMGAFDTANRMPLLYYFFANERQPDRAQRGSCLAELGSLSVEFTRLAQLTGEPRYYDAIARITDAFEEYQPKTQLPGLWPLQIDASGCKHPEPKSPGTTTSSQTSSADLLTDKDHSSFGEQDTAAQSDKGTTQDPAQQLKEAGSSSFAGDVSNSELQRGGNAAAHSASNSEDLKQRSAPSADLEMSALTRLRLRRRQLEPTATTQADSNSTSTTGDAPAEYGDSEGLLDQMPNASVLDSTLEEECLPAGLQSAGYGSADRFTLGGEADSTYEYLPKQYLLLGGKVEQYRTMYEAATETSKKYLLFRPMTNDSDRELLFTGGFSGYPGLQKVDSPQNGTLSPDIAHLTCFIGGMFAMGAKIFNRPEELEMAAKMTDTCVWAYSSTRTGVMPEDFTAVPCDSLQTCPYNETAWHAAVDPQGAQRDADAKEAAEKKQAQSDEALKLKVDGSVPDAPPLTSDVKLEDLNKRQLDDTTPSVTLDGEEQDSMPYASAEGQLYEDYVPLNHTEYVNQTIEDQGLWPGASYIKSRPYILRPEAIESVFYLYRITGDQKWRRKGLAMWFAVEKATASPYGNSAIHDVTSKEPEKNDEMESFWPAETLKYFYLLFADQDLVSLDNYVLNTEAHPFLRPDAQLKKKDFVRKPPDSTIKPAAAGSEQGSQ